MITSIGETVGYVGLGVPAKEYLTGITSRPIKSGFNNATSNTINTTIKSWCFCVCILFIVYLYPNCLLCCSTILSSQLPLSNIGPLLPVWVNIHHNACRIMSTPATATAVHQDTVTAYGAANTLVKPSARRVLGELTPNTRIESPNLHHGVDVLEALKGHSPLKQVQSLSPVRPLNAENWPDFTISGIGRKRSINEVDGAVAREEHRGYTPRRHDERETYLRDAFRPASRVNMCGHTVPSIYALR